MSRYVLMLIKLAVRFTKIQFGSLKHFFILKIRSDRYLYFERCVPGCSSGVSMPSLRMNVNMCKL